MAPPACAALLLARLGLRRGALQLPGLAGSSLPGAPAAAWHAWAGISSSASAASAKDAGSGGSSISSAVPGGPAASSPPPPKAPTPGTPATVPGLGPTPTPPPPREGPKTSAPASGPLGKPTAIPAAGSFRPPLAATGAVGEADAGSGAGVEGLRSSAEHPGRNRRFQLLGWLVPLLGIPLMFFLYMKETYKTDDLIEELRKAGANVGISSRDQLQAQGRALSSLFKTAGTGPSTSSTTTTTAADKPAPSSSSSSSTPSPSSTPTPSPSSSSLGGSSAAPATPSAATPSGPNAATALNAAVPAGGAAGTEQRSGDTKAGAGAGTGAGAGSAAGAGAGAGTGVSSGASSRASSAAGAGHRTAGDRGLAVSGEEGAEEAGRAAAEAGVAAGAARVLKATEAEQASELEEVTGEQQQGQAQGQGQGQQGVRGAEGPEGAGGQRGAGASAAHPSAAAAAAVAAAQKQGTAPGAVGAAGAVVSEPGSGPAAVPWKAPPEGQLPAVAKGTLGVTVDLSPAGLVQAAIEKGLGAANDWQAFDSAHRQAAADAQAFAVAVAQAQEFHAKELEQATRRALEAEEKTEAVRRAAMEAAEQFRALLKQHQQMALELREQEVKQAEKRVMLHASEAWLAERKSRLAALDEVRMRLGALAAAHDARAAQQAAAHESHALALGILGLTAALEGSQPLAPALTALKGAAGPGGSDPLLAAAVQGLGQAVPTRSELESEFRRTRHVLSELSHFPGTSAGMLAHAVARFATALKFDESTAVRALGEVRDARPGFGSASAATTGVAPAAEARKSVEESVEPGVDAALSVAEARLASGDLRGAAEVVEGALRGTAGGAAAAGWVASARKRAEAEQALQLLRAHASALAAALT